MDDEQPELRTDDELRKQILLGLYRHSSRKGKFVRSADSNPPISMEHF